MTKKSNLTLKNSTNDFSIVFKLPESSQWKTKEDHIETPTTLTLAISSKFMTNVIKKIIWDFNNGNKHKIITNKKGELELNPVEHKVRKAHNTTFNIAASVFTDDSISAIKSSQFTTINDTLKEQYVNPDEFKQQIIDYYATNDMSNEVATSIYKIANRMAFATNFINYSYREDMVGDAIVRMVAALKAKKFDPERGNPFSYFSTITFNAFRNRIKKEKKAHETLQNYQNEVFNKLTNNCRFGKNHTEDGDSDDYVDTSMFDIETTEDTEEDDENL